MKIGFYDSGVGGFCVLHKFLELNQNGQLDFLDNNLSIIYLADTKNCPLGDKNVETINYILQKNVQYLFELGCDLIILACNTATAVSIRHLQNYYHIQPDFQHKKILGIIKPVTEHILELNIPLYPNPYQLLHTILTHPKTQILIQIN